MKILGKKVQDIINPDKLEGDKVVWMILLLLMMLSILFIFSASRLYRADGSRLDIVYSHIKIVLISLGLVLFIYNVIKDIDTFRKFSVLGFPFSLLLLFALAAFGKQTNDAIRYFEVGGLQIHVLEPIKVAMVMYIAWATEFIEKNRTMPKFLSNIRFLKTDKGKWFALLIAPLFIIIALLFALKTSNTMVLMLILLFTIIVVIGTGNYKILLKIFAFVVVIGGLIFGTYKISNGKVFGRIETAISRLTPKNYEKQYREATTTLEREQILDALRQPYSARIAIHQGKYLGKGPGQSTQRYVVPVLSEDYMFSFIVEEYGWMSIFVIFLYLSLLARGVLITKNCANNLYAQLAIMGLVVLITGQAFLHIFVNMDFGITTGQTLPLLSNGSSAFVSFSIAFGCILSISRIANKGIERENKKAVSLSENEAPRNI